jgi:drug/metabolite transporter (DMT)-like permease
VSPSPHTVRERNGLLLCLLATAGFGSMGVLAKLAYGEGATVLTLLSVRFAIGAALLWALAAHRGVARVAAAPRAAAGALGLGLLLYSAESGLYASALTRISASLAELLMFSYPAIVVVAAIALRREPASRRRLGAVTVASGGVALVLLGGAAGAIDPIGVSLALGAAFLYAAYVLCTDRISSALHPLTFAALVCTGAAISFTLFGAASGELRFGDVHAEAWLWIGMIAVLSTAIGMSAFIAGVERLGPSRASIMSALDPIIAVVTAALVFGDHLGPVQLLGAVLVISAVVILQLPGVRRLRARTRVRGWEPVGSQHRDAPARPAPQPSAGSLALVTSERR